MYGEIIDKIISGFRTTDVVKNNKMSVVLTADDEEGTVNTSLPAIAITIQNSNDAQSYIGGTVIEDRIQIQISILLDLSNFSWSKDKSTQKDILTIASEVRNAFEKMKIDGTFGTLRKNYNFYPIYRGFTTYKRIATREQMKKEVSIYELQYTSSVVDWVATKALTYQYYNVDAIRITDRSDLRFNRTTYKSKYMTTPKDSYVFSVQSGDEFVALTNHLGINIPTTGLTSLVIKYSQTGVDWKTIDYVLDADDNPNIACIRGQWFKLTFAGVQTLEVVMG